MFMCQECGRKFSKTEAAERAMQLGCPRCGGTDIDADPSHPLWVSRRLEAAQTMSRMEEVEPDWDSLHPEGL